MSIDAQNADTYIDIFTENTFTKEELKKLDGVTVGTLIGWRGSLFVVMRVCPLIERAQDKLSRLRRGMHINSLCVCELVK